jgi:hypothetical protein
VTRRKGQPYAVAKKKHRVLLALIAERPGLRGCELSRLMTTEPVAATTTRLYRLMGLGEVERIGGKWYIAGAVPTDADAPTLSADDERVLSAMRAIPGGSSAEVAALAGCARSAALAVCRGSPAWV